jgi:hypothetical protein
MTIDRGLHWPVGKPYFNTLTPSVKDGPPDYEKRNIVYDQAFGAWLGGCCGRASKRWEWWPKRLVLTCATLKDERYSNQGMRQT